MLNTEGSPLRGGNIGSDSGLGKTSTVLPAIYHDALRVVEQAQAGEIDDASPTFIMVPPSLI